MSALDEVVQSFSMMLHEAVDSFDEDDYEKYAALSEPAKAELATLRAALAASQAREAGLRDALEFVRDNAHSSTHEFLASVASKALGANNAHLP